MSSTPGRSRYVLYEDSTFELQYVTPTFGFFAYAGKYAQTDSLITFLFKGSDTAGIWIADGVLLGGLLTVDVNVAMAMADFEDGEYLFSPP